MFKLKFLVIFAFAFGMLLCSFDTADAGIIHRIQQNRAHRLALRQARLALHVPGHQVGLGLHAALAAAEFRLASQHAYAPAVTLQRGIALNSYGTGYRSTFQTYGTQAQYEVPIQLPNAPPCPVQLPPQVQFLQLPSPVASCGGNASLGLSLGSYGGNYGTSCGGNNGLGFGQNFAAPYGYGYGGTRGFQFNFGVHRH